MTASIVLGVDGSEPAQRAAEWAATYAAATGAHVIAVHVVEYPVYGPIMGRYFPVPYLTDEQREAIHDTLGRDWCKPLADAGVDHEVVLAEGNPAAAIMKVAHDREAAGVVVGRRGRGGFAELLLGSVSHDLARDLGRPLVIIPCPDSVRALR